MADLEYAKVTGRWGVPVGGVVEGEDLEPVVVWCTSGRVFIEPLAGTLVEGAATPWTAGTATLEAAIGEVDDEAGWLLHETLNYIWVADLTCEGANPRIGDDAATHRISFSEVMAGDLHVELAPFTCRLTAAGDGISEGNVNDLTLLTPVDPGAATPIYRGERGTAVAGAVIDGVNLTFELADGTTIDAGELPGSTEAIDAAEAATAAAGTATTKAGEASGSAADSADSADTASDAATTATTKASEASTSATAAAGNQSAAEDAQAAAEAARADAQDVALRLAAAAAANAEHAANYARLQRIFLGPPAGCFLGRSGNDYTFYRGLGSSVYEAYALPRVAQSWLGVTYTLNNIQGATIQIPLLSVDETAATFTGTWTSTFQAINVGYKAKTLTVTTTAASSTVTVTGGGTIDTGDIPRHVTIPGAAAASADLVTNATVRHSSSSFGTGTPATLAVSNVVATLWPSVHYSIAAGDTAAWTSPASSIALGMRIWRLQNGGLAKVTINGDATLADLLPTAAQAVALLGYPSNILVANSGSLNPTDRVIDMNSHSASAFYDVKVALATGLAPGANAVVVTATGYTPSGGTAARAYISGFASGTAATTPATANAEMFTAYDISSGTSAWEGAIDCGELGSGNHQFISGTVHGYENQNSLSIKVNDATVTPTDGVIVAVNSAEITRTTSLFHPDTGTALVDDPFISRTTVYRLDRLGLTANRTDEHHFDTRVWTDYMMMAGVGAFGASGKLDRIGLEAYPEIKTLDGLADALYGQSRSSFAWAWDSTGKVAMLAYIPDHYGFTDGYAAYAGPTATQDRLGLLTKMYFASIGPDIPTDVPAGTVRTSTIRYVLGFNISSALAAA